MSQLAASFAGLVKSNKGLFKSEKQASFLLSQCQEENTFITFGSVYNNPFTMFYRCDSQGVVLVEKYTPKTGKTVVTWKRTAEGQLSIQDQKTIKFYKREIKALEKKLANRENHEKLGLEITLPELWEKCKAEDIQNLQEYKELLFSKFGM